MVNRKRKRDSDNPQAHDVHFDKLLSGSYLPPNYATTPIPKIAHFVYTSGKEIGWLEWLAIRGALVNLKVEQVKLWLPESLKGDDAMQGSMWKRVQGMVKGEYVEKGKVVIERYEVPEKVYGHNIPEGHRSDVARLKILWEHGGIFLENDLVALKSSDDVLYSDNTTSTIMAKRIIPESIPNWLIMSKPGSPFLKRWMQSYEGEWDFANDKSAWDQDNWDQMAVEIPSKLAEDGDPDLNVLNGHTWFYPLASEADGDATLKKLWFGKSWDDIDASYGTHVWHWDANVRGFATPAIVRTIDTPLFCRLRKLFDDVDGDGYISTPPEDNTNCSISTAAELKSRNNRIFADYRMDTDERDVKWVDSSGHNNHGFAPKGTPLRHDVQSGTYRWLGEDAFAVLPVPSGWDSREWTVRMNLTLDKKTFDGRELAGLFKIRREGDGDVVVRVGNQQDAGCIMDVEWRDLSREKAKEVLTEKNYKNRGWIKAPNLQDLQKTWHEMTITYDRRRKGQVALYLDGLPLGAQSLPLQRKPEVGLEIWINAREWEELDMGFRGSLRRFTMYADALSPEAANASIPGADSPLFPSLSSVDLHKVPVTRSQGSLIFLVIAILAISVFIARTKKALIRDGMWHARELMRKARSAAESKGYQLLATSDTF